MNIRDIIRNALHAAVKVRDDLLKLRDADTTAANVALEACTWNNNVVVKQLQKLELGSEFKETRIPWREHFECMFRMITHLELEKESVVRRCNPEWLRPANVATASFWPHIDLEEPPSDYVYFAYIHYGWGEKELVGAFSIRDDHFFYGGVLNYGGNHDLSIHELCNMFRSGYDKHHSQTRRDAVFAANDRPMFAPQVGQRLAEVEDQY